MDNIVIDTNVVIAALISRRGASYKLLSLIGPGRFDVSISVPMILEYEAVGKRLVGVQIVLSEQDIEAILDYICSVAQQHRIYYLWRPALKDPHDDMVLELAFSANCQFIVTYNLRDFQGIERFGITAITPKTFLEEIGELT